MKLSVYIVTLNEGKRLRRTLEKACIICGKKFSTTFSRKKTCSAECSAKNTHRLSKKAYQKKNPTPKRYKKICENCGKEFETSRDYQKFCCRECSAQYREKHRPPKKVRPPIQCRNCGVTITNPNPAQVFCSGTCRHHFYHERYTMANIKKRSQLDDWLQLSNEARVTYGQYRMYREKFHWTHEKSCDFKKRNLI